jgi:hypothetical protein
MRKEQESTDSAVHLQSKNLLIPSSTGKTSSERLELDRLMNPDQTSVQREANKKTAKYVDDVNGMQS